MAKTKLKIFEGIHREQMPELVKAGYKPLTIAEIIQERLNNNLSFDEYYDSASGIAYLEDKFKIIPYSQELVKITSNTPLHNGGIKLTPKEYEAIPAKESSRKDMPLNQRLIQEQVLEHQGWLELAQDKELLEKYTEQFFKQVKDRHNEDTAMGFYIRDAQDVPNLRAFYLNGLVSRSDADDWYALNDYYDARLVGVREGAEGTAQKNYTPEEISKVLKELGVSGLEEKILEKLKEQR